jgi:hypothetical protein
MAARQLLADIHHKSREVMNIQTEKVWRGKASPPLELADEIAAAGSHVLSLPGVEAMELITITCSAENRDQIVAALREYGKPY